MTSHVHKHTHFGWKMMCFWWILVKMMKHMLFYDLSVFFAKTLKIHNYTWLKYTKNHSKTLKNDEKMMKKWT